MESDKPTFAALLKKTVFAFKGENNYTGEDRVEIHGEFLKVNVMRTRIALAVLFLLEICNIIFLFMRGDSGGNRGIYITGYAILIAVSIAYSLLLGFYRTDKKEFITFLNLTCWILLMIGALIISYAESIEGDTIISATIFILSISIIPVLPFVVALTFLGAFSFFNILLMLINNSPWHTIRMVLLLTFIVLIVSLMQYSFTLNTISEYVLLNNKNKKLVEISERDPLTGILNRRGFSNIMQEYGKTVAKYGVLMIDIDNFKYYNDRYYHDAGDLCLQRVASALARSVFRREDLVVRYGGEEFLICLFDIENESIVPVAERIQNEIALMRIDLGNDNKFVTVSIGVAYRPENGKSDIHDIIAEADKELYNAKKNGKDCISYGGKIIRANPIRVSQRVSADVMKTLRVQTQHCGRKNVLIVDADTDGCRNLAPMLEPEYMVVTAGNVNEALKLLSGRNFFISAVILCVGTPGADGLDFIVRARMSDDLKNIPVIVAGSDKEGNIEKDALKSGAWDYVFLPCDVSVIKFRLKNAIERSQLPAFNQLKYLAEYDALTGIFNKNRFFEETSELLSISNSDNYVFIRFDISRFQLINSFFGFAEGDKLLKYLAHAVSDYGKFLYEYSCGRIEADTFAVCIPYENESSVVEFVDYVRDELKKYPLDFDILPTFGVYVITNRLLPVSSMLDKANLAAKEIKGNYLSGYAYYTDEMGRRLLVEQELVNDMNEALETGQFIVYMQPKYRLDTEEPSGAEALVRWKHPEKGLISPGIFIPVFERNGFIVKLDFYVWELVCKKLSQWIHEGYDPMPVSVNVSRVNLYSADLVDTLCALTEKYGVPNGMLNLEITESVYTKNPDIMREMIKKLRACGFVVMMDDFGSGYSSLNMLKDIEVDVLKIDVKFLSDTRNESRSRSIISSIIGMAKRISLMTVAEGVEKREQAEFLSLVGCDFAQGYYYARPMPCDEYENNIICCHPKSDYTVMENAGVV